MNLDKDSQIPIEWNASGHQGWKLFQSMDVHIAHAKSVHVKFRLHLGHVMIPSISPYASAALLNQVG